MKKILLIAGAIAFHLNVNCQVIQNGSLEGWNSLPFENPAGYNTGNYRDIVGVGSPTITRVTGYTGSGLRIQTVVANGDTSESYIINTPSPCNDPPQWAGGVPYSQQPTALTGYYRYSLPGNDSALMIVIFRKNGVHIGDNFILLKGTGSQPVWAPFNFPLTCSGVPDSMIFAAASSNKKTNSGIQNGSFLELDNLAFAGTTQPFPGGTFENWTSSSYDQPLYWTVWGEGASKTTGSYAGQYAVRLETMPETCGNNANASGITNGRLTPNNGPAGGIPYTATSDTLCGWYKYSSVGGSNAGVFVSLSRNGIGVGGANMNFTSQSSYTYFELPFQAGITPDTLLINIESCQWPSTPAYIGSVLYVDNLFLKSSPLGIRETIYNGISLYPNPVKDVLVISFPGHLTGNVEALFYDETGRQVKVNELRRNSGDLSVDVSGLAPGMYTCELHTSSGLSHHKFIKQ
jgi:hypothetical protein